MSDPNDRPGPPAAVDLRELVPEVVGDYLALVGEVDTAAQAVFDAYPSELACAPGCSECCRSRFEVSLVEGLYIVLGVSLLPKPEREAMVARARRAVDSLDTPEQRRRPDITSVTPSGFLKDVDPAKARPLMGPPCPILDEQGACSLYPWRAVICRYHGPHWRHPADPDKLDYCYLNFKGLRAAGKEPDPALAMRPSEWKTRLEELNTRLAGELFGAPGLRYPAPIAEYVAAAEGSLLQWQRQLKPFGDRALVAVRRFFEVLGVRHEARRNPVLPHAAERSTRWARRYLRDKRRARALDRVVRACLDKLSGQPIDGLEIARVLRSRGPEFRRHAQLVAQQVVQGELKRQQSEPGSPADEE